MSKTKKKDFKIREENANVPKGSYKDIDWEGQELEFHSDELKGGETGNAVVMRFLIIKPTLWRLRTILQPFNNFLISIQRK